MNHKIAFIDDNADTLLFAKMICRTINQDIRCLSSAETFLKMEDVGSYDLIITDLRMPVMNGYQLTTKVKELNNNIPVVICTANALPGDKKKALDYADDYISKPFTKKTFIGIIEKWCGK